jgi:hypothetical protein
MMLLPSDVSIFHSPASQEGMQKQIVWFNARGLCLLTQGRKAGSKNKEYRLGCDPLWVQDD